MNVDFLHSQVIRDTITDKFILSFKENLVPYLLSEYGSALEEICFYEDHLSEGLRINGEFYYPLTLVVSGEPCVRFVKWQVSNYRNYDKFNPFTYKGAELLEFELLDSVPAAVEAVVKNKPIYADMAHQMPVFLSSPAEDKTFLSGKYSQSFVDMLSRAVTDIIEKEFGICGLSESGVVLELRFAPSTFMEHKVENTTYRRLLIKARGCAARDLWIKWTRLDGRGNYTVSDVVEENKIEFALAEDVPGKIREKEYRYLTAESVEKYQAAMGRKNITEWREMMRRVIRRGEVAMLDKFDLSSPVEEEEKATFVEEPAAMPVPEEPESALDTLSALLEDINLDEEALEDDTESDMDDDLAALLKSAIGISPSYTPTIEEETEEEPEEDEDIDELAMLDEIAQNESDDALEDLEAFEDIEEPEKLEEEGSVRVVNPAPEFSEEKLRYELEQKIRAEMEEEIRRKHEEAEALRARLEAQLRQETREKELMAEAARNALIEQQRLAKEREEAEERVRAEEERRIEEAKRLEEERRAEQLRAAEEARVKAEAEAKAKAEAEAKARAEMELGDGVTYVSKTVKLLFKNAISADITKRIHEIILATIKYYHKEDVYIKIKANIPDATTVNLEFAKIPENEIPLLVNIIKVLGRSELGISRAILD